MDNRLYGVDLDKPITPIMARDAMVECFFEAHCADAGLGIDSSSITNDYCKSLVKKAFNDSGGDFENPSKQSIVGAMGKLQEFSVNFRDPSIIQKHAGEMMKIVEKLSG